MTAPPAANVVHPLVDWKFTQIGGGEGTKDGEWLQVSSFPTTVHVELLKLKKIPNPVCSLHFVWHMSIQVHTHLYSLLVFTNGMYNVS